ncbi:hemagglutinin repeat-containing protein [Achromobacter sp. SS2-2022]|uniref:hemagglutinin repeat-containing protein n=1 Tax=Achromobacter sp. SS2-2022 TaxID=2980498 RepID=UPI00240494CD|nr:hemagglutinin repeat-containing protein [Achromobacter sp. SS2-2022]WEX94598.1 hemagglutinin repeat-containing protein [Achromobacter sp. SS2-2022]
MMSKLRSMIVWSVVFLQVWSPVLAQTLPITVDKSVVGAKPAVGVTNGVPVINIAPPSAGGVSNNRYTQFNVGPSGAVLNNSGGASQTQLAGQVAGNIMLGNQRATTILNQVTAPNPSQLLGTLEVAGNRANIIVANPAGITCNGCGFLNADRATLTTGRPQIGADGRIGFDIASGKLRVEGDGLYGANLSQVDLLARTLEINAGVWADRLNVTAGAARVDYGTGAVSAQVGQGAKPDVALDTAALGGMYANSIRLIGTEAGVGVNIGGNLVALTGDLHVDAAGDLRITPSGTAQAAGAVRMASGRDLAVQGTAQAAGATTLIAGRDASIQGAVGAGGPLSVRGGKDVTVGAQGSLRTQGALAVVAGRDLALSGHLLTADQDIKALASRNLKVAGVQASVTQPGAGTGNGGVAGNGGGAGGGSGNSGGTGGSAGDGSGNSGSGGSAGGAGGSSSAASTAAGTQAGGGSVSPGVVSAKAGVTLEAGRNLVLPRQVYTSGNLLMQAGADLASDAGAHLQSAQGLTMRAGGNASLAGVALTDGALSIDAGRHLRMDGSALAYGGALDLNSGSDLRLGQASKAQGKRIVVNAGGDVRTGGDMVSETSVDLKAGGNALLAGTLSGNQGVDVRAAGTLGVVGAADAARGAVTLASGGDLSIGAGGSVQAGGPVVLRTEGALNAAGTVSSMAALSAQAARDAKVDGKLLAGGSLLLQADGQVKAGANARLQSEGAMTLLAGKDLSLAGEAQTNAGLMLNAGRDLRIDGAAHAYAGALALTAGNTLQLGKASRTQGDGVSAQAGGDFIADGAMASRGDMVLAAGRDTLVGGQAQATGKLDLQSAGNVTLAQGARVEAERSADILAGQDILIAGALRSNEGNRIGAKGALRLDGEISVAQGGLDMLAGKELSVGKQGKAVAGGALQGKSGGALTVDGALSSKDAQTLTAARDINVGGQLLSGDRLSLRAGQALETGAAARLQSAKNMTLSAGQDAKLAGSAVSDGAIAIDAARDLNVDGSALAHGGALNLNSRNDLRLGENSQVQGLGVAVAASRDLYTSGEVSAVGAAVLTAGNRAMLGGKLGADGDLTLRAADAAYVTGTFEATGSAALSSDSDITLAGSLRSNLGAQVNAASKLDITGAAEAVRGALNLGSGSDLSIGARGRVQAAGPLALRTGGALNAAGTVSSLAGLTAQAAHDAIVDGKLLASGPLSLKAFGKIVASAEAHLQSEATMTLQAGQDLFLAGEAQANAGITLDAGDDLRIDGAARAYDGALALNAGKALRLGESSRTQGEGISATAGSDLYAAGTMGSRGGIELAAGRDARVDSTALASGDVSLVAARDLNMSKAAQWEAEGASRAAAGNAMRLSGAWRGNGDMTLAAVGALTVDGALTASVGGLDLSAGGDLSVGALARMAAAGPLRAKTDGDLHVAGTVSSLKALTLQAARNASISNQLYAAGALDVQAGQSLTTASGSHLQSDGAMALNAGQDLTIAGTALSERGMALAAVRDLRVEGNALAEGGTLDLKSGNDLLLGVGSQLQGMNVQGQSGRDLAVHGVLVSKGDALLRAERDAGVTGKVGVDGSLNLNAGNNIRVGAAGQLEASKKTQIHALGDATVAGAVRGDRGTSIQAGGALAMTGTAASAKGPLQLIAGQDLTLSSDSQAFAGGALLARAGASLMAAGTMSSLADLVLDAAANMTVAGQTLATGALSANVGGVLTARADSRLQADGAIAVNADTATLAGMLVAGQSAQVQVQNDLTVEGTVLADKDALVASSGGDMTLGGASALQAGGKLDARAGGKLLAAGSVSSETDIVLTAGKDAELTGKTVANGALAIDAGRNLAVAENALAQGSGKLLMSAGQDLRIAGTAGTAEGAGTRGAGTQGADTQSAGTQGAGTQSARSASAASGGTLHAQAGRDLSITDTGIVTAGSPIALKATRDINIEGIATVLAGSLQADAGSNLQVGAAGRMQAFDNLAASAGADLDSDGVIAAGGGLTLAAGASARLGGVVAALGERAAGDALITAQHDLTVKQGAQVQAAGTLTARAGRDLNATGALSSVADMALAAARDLRINGTAASDANLTLTGRDLSVAATGLAQAGGTLAATAQGALLAAGRLLAGQSQALIAGTDMTVDGTVAALNGNLTLTSQRDDLALGAASTVQASGALTAEAGAALRTQGSLAAGQGMALRAGTDATLGGIAATQAGDLTARAAGDLTVAAEGRLQSNRGLDLQAGGALANAGVVSAQEDASVRAGKTLLNPGSVLAGGDLLVTTPGLLSNAGRLVAGVDGDGALKQPGSLTLAAGTIVHPGTSLAGKDLSLTAGGLDLTHGTLSAVGNVKLGTPGAIDTRHAVVQGGGLDISAANLRNQAGKLTSTGDARLALSGELNNAEGLIAAAGDMRVDAATVINRAGTLAGGNLVINASGAVDNHSGLIQADNALTLTSATLDNSATLGAAKSAPQGVLGKVVTIVADRVNNQGGSIQAGHNLTLTTRELDNQGGEVAAQGNAHIVADTLKNGQGKLLGGNSLTVIAHVLHGLGTLQSAGDLSFHYAGALNQPGDLSSGRDMNLSVGGAVDNSATISAGRDLNIKANSLTNHATGQLLAGGANTITVAHDLINAGLIDGAVTRINAGSVDNLARIYGDKVAILANTLVNRAGTGGGAVIASRGAMDLGVATLVNRAHALIYAGADLATGGALDAGGNAVGQAASLLNTGATIEAAGNARISAASLHNHNANYASQTVQVSSQAKVYFTPAGSTDMYDAETNWLCDEVTPMCSKDPAWLNDDPERMFLLPSAKYPQARYGPPFDYTPGGKRKARVSSPIAPTYTPANSGCSGGDAGGPCWDEPEKFLYASDARIWAVFGVTPPTGTLPIWVPPASPCIGNRPACVAEAARRKAYEAAYAAYKTPHLELNARIREFNADFNNRLVGSLTYYQVNETVTETRTLSSDPGKILSGGAMTLAGTVTNDKSQIAAGGALSVAGSAIHNVGASGQRTITREGRATLSQPRSSYRYETSVPYTAKLAAQGIELPVGTSGGYTNVTLGGSAPGPTGVGTPGPVLVASLDLPGGTVVRTVSNPASIPDSQLFAVNQRPDAPYLVATDPRFIGQRPTVSSDYLFELLRQPGALPDTSIAGGAGAGGGLTGPRVDQPADASLVQAAISAGTVTPQAAAGPAVGAGSGGDAQRLDAPAASSVHGAALGSGSTIAGHDVQGGKTLSSARLAGWDTLVPKGARFLTPSGQPKRLGDGFYEQKLVSDQILATTGQRFLERFGDNDSQYKALLAAGAQFARDHNVQVGVALTDAQQRQLKTDLVWLVAQTVTLPDGSAETVLVPKVYLLVRKNDLKGDGTLMAGRDVKLVADGNIDNSGTIGARHATVMSASNIVNQAGGLVQGATVDLSARTNLTNLASRIKGDAVTLKAGRDIALTSTAASENFGSTWGSHVTGVARVDAGDLNMRAGRDINLTAAQVNAERNAGLQAGRDINLETLTERHGESIVINKKNRHDLSTSKEIGSSIAAGGNLTLIAGQDVNARAADVTADKKLAVGAGRDINLTAGVESGSAYDELHYKKRGFLSSKTTHIINSTDWEQAKGSTFTGDTAVLMAGRDLNVAGSNTGAQKDLVMSAKRDVNILPGQNAEDSYDYKMVKKSGFGAMGGLSYGTSKQTDSLDSKKVFHNASTVGSVEGDVLINAGSALNIKGGNVIARRGDITLIGKEVNIGAALDTTKEKEFHEIKQTGLSINANTPLVDAMQTAGRMGDAAGRTDNKVMQGLALATTGLAAANAYDAVAADPKSAGGVSVSINFGVSKSQSTTDRASSSALGSTVAAGKDLTIVAKGAGSASDVTVTGSRLSAGNNTIIKADGDILLQAAQNTFEQHTKNKSYSGSVGIGVSANSEDGIGVMLNLSAGGGRGRADGKDANWTYTDVTAGNVLTLQSGGDTSLIGAIASADQIIASVGKNLQIETLQDTSTYVSKQQSAGVQASICIYGYCKSSVSGNVSQGRMDSNFQSATQQAGLKAGDGGFLVNVGQNTTLTGGVVSSSDQAVADGLNELSTGTLVVKDLQNMARYKADQVALSGGYSWGGSGEGDAKKGDVGTNSKGQAAGGADKVPGTSLPTSSNGASAGMPVVVAASGNANSTTHSAISGGSVVIRDGAGQIALTGKTAAETIAALNRDTSDTLNALKPIFDKEKIEAGFEIASEASRQMGQFLTNRAKEKQAAEKALSDAIDTGGANDAASMSALMDQVQRARDWSAGGKYGLVLLALSGGAGANVTGSTSAFVQSAAVNFLQGLGAAQVKQIADSLGRDPQAEAARAALHGIVGCAGAAGQGAACASGALGASAGSILNSLMGSPEGLTPEQVDARRNLVTSLVAGIASAAGADAATAGTAAGLETSQNWGQFAIPAVSAAAAKCATTPSCQRAVTYVSDKTVYVAVQMKDGAIYVGTAALVGITAASDAVGNWVSEFVGSAVGRETALPGKPGEVVRVDTPPPMPSEKETFGSEIPSWPGEPVGSIGVPGQENNGPSGGATMISPIPGAAQSTIIFQQGHGQRIGTPYVSSGVEVTPDVVERALRGDPAFGIQGAVSLPAIQRYVDRLLAGEVSPPIKMDGDVIVDGNHRYIAARILGREVKVVPSVLPNSLRDKKSSISKIEVDSADWGNH